MSRTSKTPPATWYILQATKQKKGAATPQKPIAEIKRADLVQIAEAKMDDLSATTVDAAVKIIAGSARSMGIKVVG